jgi:electron transport complex protein RnfB
MIEVFYPLFVLGLLGIVLGVILSLANRYLHVQEDPRIDVVEKLLPGYNCGACGTPGCRAFAEAILNGDVKNVSKCRPGKPDKHFNPILEYLKDHPNPDGSSVNAKL